MSGANNAGTMLGLYNASVSYIENEIDVFGHAYDGFRQTQESRIVDIRNNLPKLPRDIADSEALMKVLTKETPAFTGEQRKEIRIILSTHMKSSAVVSADATGTKLQNNVWLHNYLTEPRWTKQQDPTVCWDEKA